ncbi:MAG: hypothetical protein RMM53_12380, partial [Bacteroidia bacterium]|nr:hypothetical protein [Bacteroidia bacterium]MDW8335003.1 hypothetical protein [Bacteroidia bacterium]
MRRFICDFAGTGLKTAARLWAVGFCVWAAVAKAQNFAVAPAGDNDSIPGAVETLTLYDGPSAAFGTFFDGGIFASGTVGRMLSTGRAQDAAGRCAYTPGVPVWGAPHDFAQLRIEFTPLGDTLELSVAVATHEYPERFPGGSLYMNAPDVFSIALTFDGQIRSFSPSWQWTDNIDTSSSAFATLNFSAYSRPETWRVPVPVGRRCVLTASVRDGGDPWVDSAIFLWAMRVFPVYDEKYVGRLHLEPEPLCSSAPFEARILPQRQDFFPYWRAPGLTPIGDLSGGGKRWVASEPGVYRLEAEIYERRADALVRVTTLRTEAVVFPGPKGAISGPTWTCADSATIFGLQYDYATTAQWDFGPSSKPRFYEGFSPPPVVFSEPGNHNVFVRLFNERCETALFHTVRVFSSPPSPPKEVR